MKKTFAILMIVMLVMCFIPSAAFADTEYEAKIGETPYVTLDEAIAAASEGDTITLLKDAKVNRTFYKSLTFTGGYKLSMDVYGWRYNGNLVFDGADFEINSDETSPVANNGEAARWFTMVAGGSITARNNAHVTFSFDSDSGTNCAIYTSHGVTINVENNSQFHIFGKNTKGMSGQGIQLDNTAGTGIFVKNQSEFLIDGTNRGYVNSPSIYVEDSVFTVQNCTSNGSNGGMFTAINSKINFLNNAGHGLSVGDAVIKDSLVCCNGNGYTGFHVAGNIDAQCTETGIYKTKIDALGNSWNTWGNDIFAGLRLNGNASVGKGVTMNVSENYGVGIRADSADTVYCFDEEVLLSIKNNGKITSKGIQYNTKGGGIWNKGIMTIPSNADVYNNHATTAGDDIYNDKGASIIFGKVGSGWKLDGEPDCTDYITGWFDDSANSRWNAHGEEPLHIEEFIPTSNGIAEEKSLKAAHGKISPVIPPYIPPVTHYYTVTYNDGVDGEVVFNDQINRGLSYYTLTPYFNGTPMREGYVFKGWTPAVAERVTADAYYKALWEKYEEPTEPTKPTEPEKPTKPEKPTNSDKPTKPAKPDTQVPKTGDMSFEILLVSIFALALSAAAGLIVTFRKKVLTKK